jgi:hypothetical protein
VLKGSGKRKQTGAASRCAAREQGTGHCSIFAAATRGAPSSGGLTCRTDDDVGVRRRGDPG